MCCSPQLLDQSEMSIDQPWTNHSSPQVGGQLPLRRRDLGQQTRGLATAKPGGEGRDPGRGLLPSNTAGAWQGDR